MLFLKIWIALNFILTLSEGFFLKRKSNKENYLILAGNLVIFAVAYLLGWGLFYIPLNFAKTLAWFEPVNINLFTICLGVLLCDFFYYLKHFTGHKIRFFWNQHQVHHSANEFDLSVGYRKPWLSNLYDGVFYAPLVLMGFPPTLVFASYLIVQNYNHSMHLNKKIPLLEKLSSIFVTPQVHKIHHSSLPEHIDKNFGGMFVIWDKLFGTYLYEEDKKIEYGLTKKIYDTNPVIINFNYWLHDFKIMPRLGFKKWLAYIAGVVS